MIILIGAQTGKVQRFTRKLPIEANRMTSDRVIDKDFVLITFTTGLGKDPDTNKAFLETNSQY